MTTHKEVQYLEVDERLYKVVETEEFYKAFALTKEGTLKEVPPSRILAVGYPISRGDFCTEARDLRVASGRSSGKACSRGVPKRGGPSRTMYSL